MNLDEKIKEKIKSFKSRKSGKYELFIKHARLAKHVELKEIINNYNCLYVAHNGYIELGLGFDEVVKFLKIHPTPSDIKVRESKYVTDPFRSISTNFKGSEYSYILDLEINQGLGFFNEVFGLEEGSLKSCIVEPSRGLRIDKSGQAYDLIERVIDENIPFFTKINLNPSKEDKKTYVYNGFGFD